MFQLQLFGGGVPRFDASFSKLTRVHLDATAWVDFAPSWVQSSDALFETLLAERGWGQRTRRMYEQTVTEPRLTSLWTAASGSPLTPPLLEAMRAALSERYGVTFDSVGFNLYRDGRDSVAWHRDHLREELREPVVVLVSLGEPRRFLLRPHGGGPSRTFQLGRGDLLVTGGLAQRTWEHSVPKVAHAGPRMSLAFRHGMKTGAYPPARSRSR